MSTTIPVAILFAYQGFEYDGLERKTGMNSVESVLFKAIAKQYTEQISMTHISRSKITYEDEHAAKQVLSVSLGGTDRLPEVGRLNQDLPETIRVFKVLKVDENFSARRTCEARTIEFLIPTYAFQHPPEATEYCYPEQDQPEPAPELMPAGGMFKTNGRKTDSMARRQTFLKPIQPPPEPVEKKSEGLFSCFKNLFSSKKATGSERLKQSLNATLTRQPAKQEEDFGSTLRRSMSRSNRTLQDVLQQDITEREDSEKGGTVFEPLQIPEPTSYEKDLLRQYRMTRKQYNAVQSALALYNGTHNFHNYISGSVQDDSRCFVHIFNIECAPPEIHKGMEWIRIKVQAHSFARDQIRKMMAMLIMVIRTNTPRSVIGNSFGVSKIDIPDTPVGFLILDQPHYNNYNADSERLGRQPVHFGDITGLREFRVAIHEAIFEKEVQELSYEQWLRQVDNYSFMYTHFLNQRGLILKPKNMPRSDVAPAAV